ncbi:MAG: hypothetical protein IPO06_07590 [Leptospiraceae bacterium]|nr:hypothetical protein [Leptospiraceae bacterium]
MAKLKNEIHGSVRGKLGDLGFMSQMERLVSEVYQLVLKIEKAKSKFCRERNYKP